MIDSVKFPPLKSCFLLIFLLILISCSDNDQFFDGGSGTEANPFQISTVEQLQEIGEEENLEKHFIQVADIDAAAFAEDGEDMSLKPIGNRETPFTGTYNGNGYKITGTLPVFSDLNAQHLGLFGYVRDGVIENVNLKYVSPMNVSKGYSDIEVSDQLAVMAFNIPDLDIESLRLMGSLVGFNDGGIIRNVHTDIALSSRRHHIGGLAGYSSGEIIESSAKVDVSAFGFGGGLVVYNTGLIEESHASGRVSGTGAAGGLAGMNDGGEILRSYSDGEVFSGFRTGGLVGINSGYIENSLALGIVDSGPGPAGGFAGVNGGEISNSYSNVEVSAFQEGESIGGFIGMNTESGTVQTSYATGLIDTPGELIVGGFIGDNVGQKTSCYWDTETTGQSKGVGEGNPDGATGLTTEQMTGPAAEQNMPEFDWMNTWRTTDGYPVMRWEQE